MARTRDIKPAFFKNEYLAECDPMARLLFVGLWTLADRDGRIECRPLRIKAELFPYDNVDIVAMLEQLRVRGFVRAYDAEGVRYIDIPGFCVHQKCHPREQSEGHPAWEDCENVDFHGEKCEAGTSRGKPRQAAASRGQALPSNPFPSFPSLSSSYPSDIAPTETRKPRSRSQPSDSIRWTPAAGWEGITDADRAAWATAYPACDIPGELARMTEWLRANPAKARKSRWRAFATSWLTRSQDRGGGQPSARPGDRQPAALTSRRWRDDACQNMTDERYRAWRAAQRPTQAALDIAGRLSVPAGDNG